MGVHNTGKMRRNGNPHAATFELQMEWKKDITHSPRSRTSCLLAALIGASFLSSTGCCAISYTVSNISGTLEPSDLTVSTPVYIRRFELAEDLQEKHREIGSVIRKSLSESLWYDRYNVPFHLVEDINLDNPEPGSIVIEGIVTKFEFGSGAARFARVLLLTPAALTPPKVDILGARAKANVRISRLGDPPSLLVEFQVEVHDSSVGGVESGLGVQLAHAILNFINKRVDLGRPVLSPLSCPTYIEQ